MLSVIGSIALLLIGLMVAFFGWLAFMQHRVEPEHTTKAAARGGCVWMVAGAALIGWGLWRFFQ